MKVKYTAILLLILLVQSAKAQCDYTINAVVTQHSIPCARDGIITVTLSGPDVDSGNILPDGVQYGITSTEGGNNIAPSANGGVITQVPPGTYQVQVKAMCKIGNKWVSKNSETTITIDGNYSPPNPVEITGMVSPYKCDSTGSIAINVSGGLPPYKLTVTNDNGYSQVLDVASEGGLTLSNLPEGNYKFSLKDNCGYFPSDKIQQLDAKVESFEVDWWLPPASCKTGGTLPVSIYEGKPPFSIIVASTGYSDTIDVSATGYYPIDNLPPGNYTITVKDACGEMSPEYRTIDKSSGGAYIWQTTNSPDCGTGEGLVRLGMWGEAPFIIDITSNTAFEGKFPVTTTTDTAFSNLKPGDYTFNVIDDCGDTIATINQTIDEIKFDSDDNVVTTDIEGSGKGSATIKTTGGTPWIIESISETVSGTCTNSYTLPVTVYSPDTVISDLCAGTYKVVVKDMCDNKDSTTFTINLKPITSSPIFGGGTGSGYGWSECNLCRDISLPIDGGTGNYDLFFIQNPADPAATPENPVFITSINTTPAIAIIPNLIPGDYTIRIVDADLSVDPFIIEFNIDSILSADFFEEFIYPDVNSANCKSLKARINWNIYYDWYQIFDDELFDVKFKIIGTTFETDSIRINPWYQDIEFDLPDSLTYKIMRDNGFEIEAIIGSYEDTCHVMIDTIRFNEVRTNKSSYSDGCDGFVFHTWQDYGSYDVFCYPYEQALFNEDGNIVNRDTINNYYTSTYAKVPYGKYKMVFTDAEGYQWIDSIEYTHLSYPWIDYYSIQPLNENCRKYDLTFNVYSICPPYEWVLYDENNVFLKKDTIYDSSTPPLIDSLSYNTYYNIVVTSLATNETTTTTYYRDQAATSLDYTIGQVNVACLPDTAKGYIDIFRNGYYPVLFGAGTRFEFIDGPTRPLHDTLVAVGDEYHLYPFSVDSTIAENVKLSEGLYRFKVTDTCGFVDTLRVDYKTYKVVDFRYEMQYDCNSALLIPSATVYLGNDALPYYYYYFRLLEAPPLTSYYSLESVYSGGTIQLTVPGHYKLQLSTIYQSPGSPDACSLDTIDFYYSPEISKVTFDKVDAYICDEGNGYIEFLVKGGIGNISYVLIGPGDEILKEEILPKGTPFTYDNAEKNVAYKVEFRDMNCSGAGGSEIITVSNLVQDRLIFGPGALCSGETINLYSDVPAESYLWTFPNGLGTSTLANPVIYNASAEHKGIYNLEITNVKGCLANFSRSIDIDVFNTVVPEADSMKYVCVGNSTEPVEATVSPGYKLIWYNEHKVEIPVAPSYSTTKADTFRYFVSQYETSLFCYSDTIPVTIIVEDLPAPVAAAFAGDICKNTPPLVLIPNADSSYVYRIYNSDNILVGVDTARSDTLKLQTTDNSFVAAGTLYLEVENNHGCVSSGKLDVPVKVVYPAPPVVYDTFYCLDAVAVPLRADSAKGNYLRWYDTDGATALPSSPTPPTDVAGTFTYWVAQADTLLGCEGDKVALEVVIIDLPDILIDAVAPEICRGISPSVTIGVTNDLYTYTVFDKTNVALVSGIADGTPLNLQLPSYILYENDTLHVEVKSAEQCISKDRAVVPVDVIIPPVPVAKDTFYCVNAAALQLSATAAPGYSIQWHDLNGAPVSAAPVPPTTVADTLIYNITQKHNLLGCESDTIQATIIIIALPDPVVAVSQDICPGQYPKIEIEETLPGYIYKVYSESGTLLETRQGTGDSIIIAIPETIDKPTIYFVETINTYGCASKDKSQVETYVKVNIDDLPDMNINATASGICRETSPVIIVGKTKDLFTYILFDKDDNILLSAVADGTPLSLNPDLVLSGNDTLYIEIRDKQGCPSVGKVVVPVDVVIPPVPVTTDTSYCVNDISSQLVATADEGYYIQWYDLYDAPLNTAPAPSTAEAGTFVYKITQRHETLHCESDPVKANVRVEALPAAVDAIAQDICPGQFPKIEIRETLAGYVYNVYSAQGTLLMTRQSDGDSIMFFVPESLTESEIYLVETVNTSGCISGDRTTVEAKVVNYAYINPDAIPKYERGKQYSFQLETNAVYPYEFTADGLMYGFAINATGLISGIPTVNGLLDSIPFMVRVMDINGCFATKDYILKSELFVPQVITPNGDGKNDVFMKGRKLVIFDRLGLEIYEGADGWDGKKTDGSIVAPDTYFYTIFRENGSNEVEKRGYITLIRK